MIRFFSKIMYFILCIVLFLEIVVYFLPKKQIWFYTQQKLEKYYISLNSKGYKDKGYEFLLKDNSLKYDKLNVATSKKIEVFPLIFINKVKIKNIKLSEVLSDMFPSKIEKATLYWSPLCGYKIEIEAKGDMGNAHGFIDVLHRKVVIDLEPSKIMKRRFSRTLREFKKVKTGYRYVKTF